MLEFCTIFLGDIIAIPEACIDTGTENEIEPADVSINTAYGSAYSGT